MYAKESRSYALNFINSMLPLLLVSFLFIILQYIYDIVIHAHTILCFIMNAFNLKYQLT